MKLFITITFIHFLALISPGPDFIMIMKQSLTQKRSSAQATGLGFGIGILVHMSYIICGLGILISKSILIFNIIKILGAFYLIYIGYKSIGFKFSKQKTSVEKQEIPVSKQLNFFESLKLGILTNILNPKVTLFLLTLFSQFISDTTSINTKIFLGLWLGTFTTIYFVIIATLLTHKKIQTHIKKVSRVLEKVFGALLITLGIKVLATK